MEAAAGSRPESRPSTEGSNASPAQQGAECSPTARSYPQVRREAWRLRSGQRGLVHDLHRSLSCCGLGRKPVPGENPDDALAELAVDHAGGQAELGGLLRCASPWACPVCAPKVAACRARVLAPQVAARLAAGWSSWLVTLTLRHGRDDVLADLFAGLGKGWSRLTSGKNGKALRALGAPEFVRGLDLTWSDRHGWHPHVHVVLLLPPGHGTGGATARAFAARWRRVMGGLGFEALPGAQDVQPCRDAMKAARYATSPAAVYEAVGIATKEGRNPRAGMTAFDLLRAAVPASGVADPRLTAKWCEYVAAVKGRRQTTVSRGLSLSEDAVLLEEEPDDRLWDPVAQLGRDAVAEIDRARLGPDLLEAVEAAAGDPEAARAVARRILGGLAARDWWIVQWRALPEPEPLPCLAWTGPPPVRPWQPPLGWSTPFSPDGRTWRPVTRRDREILVRLGL